MGDPFGIQKTLRGPVPRLPYADIKTLALGPAYELSLVICGDHLARSLNKKYREKTYAANVLSFPLGKMEGEIFLNLRAAEREAHKYGVPLRARLALLFIHGLFHLKGLAHGAAMERSEQQVLKRLHLD